MADPMLAAIRSAPADDRPRLIYADYVEERGDPARAEFIRVQCELATCDDADERRAALEDREHELLAANEATWFAPAGVSEWEWRRGFVDEVTLEPAAFAEDLTESLADHAVTDLTVETVTALSAMVEQPDLPSSIRHVHYQPGEIVGRTSNLISLLSALPSLDGFSLAGTIDSFRLLTPSLCERLRSLNLQGIHDDPGNFDESPLSRVVDVYAIIAAVGHTTLDRLAMSHCCLTETDLRALVASPICKHLKSLDLSDNPISMYGHNALASAACRLTELNLSGSRLNGYSKLPFLDKPACADLTRLDICHCHLTRRVMKRLADSPFWAQATHLWLRQGNMTATSLEALYGGSGPSALRLLDLAENHLETLGVVRLCGAPWSGELTWLDLSGNNLDDDAMNVIAGDGRFCKLRTLHLMQGDRPYPLEEVITDVGVRRLASAPSLQRLRVLTLSGTAIAAASIEAVLNTEWRLSGLGVSNCNLGPEAVSRLTESPRLARLQWLDLSDNPSLGGDTLRPLAESPDLSRLCELDIGGIHLDAGTREALRRRLGRRLSE